MKDTTLWMLVGFAGQALFASRFLLQWLASERARRSVMPTAFWFLSLGGGLVLLAYAIHRADPVFIAGQATGLIVYSRNIWFLKVAHREDHGTEAPPAPEALLEGDLNDQRPSRL